MSGDPIAQVLGVAQVPMRTRLPQYTYADLLGRVAHGALADAQVDGGDVDGVILAMSPTTTLGIDEPHFWALSGLPGAARFLGRVHTLASSGLVAFRLACSYVAAKRAKRVLVLAADLADEAPDLIGAITALGDPFAPRAYPQSAITAHAFQASAYMARNRLDERDMAHVIVKNRRNGVDNEYAQLREAVTADDVLASPVLSWPIKRLDASPRSSGAAAVLVGAPEESGPHRRVTATGFGSFANHGVAGSRMVPGIDESYFDAADLAAAARRAYRMAGIGDPTTDLDLAEIYASFGIIELLGIEGLGLTGGRNAARLIGDGHFHRDAKLPVNASGGATCGTPISATGLIRIVECALQLRGEAGARQIAKEPHRAVAAAIGGLFQLHDIAVLAA